ncbi:MAG: c-type cytochrome [Woeseiaceae bacterium]|nr:c-type cytochrome [Woeseiaceae bacterium]
MSPGIRSFLLSVLFVPVTGIGADATAGEALYAPCVACHGANGEGNPTLSSPAIAGQSEEYLVRQLQNFRSGIRGTTPGDTAGAQMGPMAAALADDAAVADVAAHIARLDAPIHEATVSGDSGNGSKLYVSRCGACHAGRAEGNDALFAPRLTGLRDAYIIRQVQNFRTGTRGAHADDKYGKQMAIMAKVVTDQELKDIVAFLNELARQ